MANYLPPTEDLPIFDNSVFEVNNTPLTFNDAITGFLTFPYAQGNETFQDIIVDGTTYFANQVDNASIMPPPNNATTIVPTTQWVQDAIAAAPVNPTITTTATSSATPLPIPILSTATAGSASLYVDSDNGITYTPSTNTLTTATFSGSIQTSNITNPSSLPLDLISSNITTIPGLTTKRGMMIGWDESLGNGETDIRNYSQGGSVGGFNFSTISSSISNLDLLTLTRTSSTFTQPVTAPSFIGPLSGTATTATNALACSGNSATATTATQSNSVNITNTTSSINYFLPLMTTTTTGYKNLFGGGSIAFNPSINTMSTANFSASASMSSPYYTSPSGGISRWYSTDNLQYGQIWSDNTYNLYLSPAYKLALTMNTTGPSNSGAVNSINKQGCDIGWNYNGNGSTDFYNNAGIQATTTHTAYSFWDASTALIQQAIAYIPRIQSGYGATGLNLPTYDWVNGTITNAIGSITPVTQIPVTNTVIDTDYFLPMLTSTSTGQKTVYAGGNITINPATDTIDHVYLFGLSNAGVVSQIYNQGSNMVLQSDVGTPANTYFRSRNNGSAIPVGSVTPAGTFGTVIGYNTTAGQYETDLLNYSGNLANVGGFNFYTGGASSAIAQCGSLPRTQPVPTDATIKIPTTNTVQRMIKQGSGAPVILFNGLVYIQYPSAPIVSGLWVNPYLVTAGVSYSTTSLGNMAITVAGVGANFQYGTVMGSFPDIGSNQGVTFYGNVVTGGTDLVIGLNRVSGPTVSPVSQNGNINIVVYAVPLVVIS